MLSYEGLTGYDLAATVAYNAGFRNHPLIIAIAIAQAESDCVPDMIGDVKLQNDKWGPSIGMWQVRSLHHPDKYAGADSMRIEEKLFDPQYNANVAFLISKKGVDFDPWSTYTGNNYRKFINQATEAVGRLPQECR